MTLLEERDHFEDLGTDCRRVLELILMKQAVAWFYVLGSGQWEVTGYYEHGNELPGSEKKSVLDSPRIY